MVSRKSRLAMSLGCALVGVAVLPVVGLAADSVAARGDAAAVGSANTVARGPLAGTSADDEEGVLGSSLPAPFDEAAQQRSVVEAHRFSPAAIIAREVSWTAYRGLGAVAASRLAASVFPGLVDEPAAGPPRLGAGARIVRYPSPYEAQAVLAGGKHVLLASSSAMAAPTGGGRFGPLDLTLRARGGSFVPRASLAAVALPRRLAGGVALADGGVSLTPVSASGAALGGAAGVIEGASVFYANAQLDTDVLAKPLADGFTLDALLRSPDSPERLFFRVGAPHEARLVRSRAGDEVRVSRNGKLLARITAPTAEDAEGTPVPLAMALAGDVLVLTVRHAQGSYRYPIDVDPTVEENVGGTGGILYKKTWSFYTEHPEQFKVEAKEGDLGSVTDEIWPSPLAGQYGFFYYRTQGESKIYSFTATTSSEAMAHERILENVLGIFNVHTHSVEAQHAWIGKYAETTTVCSAAGCAPGSVSSENDETEAFFKQDLRENWEGERTRVTMSNVKLGITQEAPPTISWSKEQSEAEAAGGWTKSPTPVVEASDPGVGLLRETWSSPQAPSVDGELSFKPADGAIQGPECDAKACGGDPARLPVAGLPNGEDTLEASVEDGVGLKATTRTRIKVDDTPPVLGVLEGVPANDEIAEGVRVQVKATDGSGSLPSSGVREITLQVGRRSFGPSGSCSPGPCTATGQWVLSDLPMGPQTVTAEAIDNAGNSEHLSLGSVTVVPAETAPVGPGAVNLESGAFMMTDADVSVPAYGGALTFERSYDSRVEGEHEGPFGPQWQDAGFAGEQGLTKLSQTEVALTGTNGVQAVFTRTAGSEKFVSPPGDGNLVLAEVASSNKYTLSDQRGDVTRFTVPEGGTGSLYTPSEREEPGHSGVVAYTFRTVSGVTEPVQALAAPPPGVSCKTLVKGCRALAFTYASKTSATGEAPSEWGEYTGRLMSVSFTAYNPSSNAMQTIPVAQYTYDKKGRLRAEWDPRLAHPLKTTYGYDARGDLTAISPAGQQPWLLQYGTIESDATEGRLISVSRPAPETALGATAAPALTKAPSISGTLAAGERVSVSNGSWSNGPLAYSYQWERCNSSGAECEAMPGATSESYVVREDDEAHTLAAVVTATNADGSTTTSSASTAAVAIKTLWPWKFVGTFGKPGAGNAEFSSPSYVAASGKEWSPVAVTDTGNDRVEQFNANGDFLHSFGEAGSGANELSDPTGIAMQYFSPNEPELWVADAGNERLVEYAWNYNYEAERQIKETPVGSTAMHGIAFAEKESGGIFAAVGGTFNDFQCLAEYWGNCYEEYQRFGGTGSGNGEFENPNDVAVSPVTQDVYVLDTGNDRVEYFSAEDGWRNGAKYLGQFGEAGSGPGQFKEPKGIAIDPEGDVLVVDSGNDRVQELSPTGAFRQSFGEPMEKIKTKEEIKKEKKGRREEREQEEAEAKATEAAWLKEEAAGTRAPHLNDPIGAAISNTEATPGPDLSDIARMFVVDSGDDRVMKWDKIASHHEPLIAPPAPAATGSAVWTIAYAVPTEGEHAPYQFPVTDGEAPVGQQEHPVTGTAIFAPDEPMGWPAKDYTRATIYYQNEYGRTVNTAAPGGAIATTEYNGENDVIRTLSPDNRALAIKEKNNGATLSTDSAYNKEGDELEQVTGPELRLGDGVRKVTKYSYDEGAPSEGGPYSLVTKETQGAAESPNGRITETSYAGQEGLGWKLQKPTSTIGDPGSLKLTHTTLYEKETGEVSEVRPPANPTEPSPHATESVDYTASSTSKVEACANHAEWAGLACEERPAKQPEAAGLPGLATTKITYNIWDEPEKTTETVEVKGANGSEMITRTKTIGYDAAGRVTKTAVSSTAGEAIPAVLDEYSPETGLLVKQTSEGTGQSITAAFNSLGELTSYTDAAGNTSTYHYDIDGRLETSSEGKATQTRHYDPTTGFLTKLEDSAGGTFEATYDTEGNILTETYPDGLTAKWTYNQVDEPIALEYVKTTDCTENCVWFKDAVSYNIFGQWATQTSTLSEEEYRYDGDGRLSEVFEKNPNGKNCVVRVYAYDADSNRTSITTRGPDKKACPLSGGTVESHSYDEADRLTDPGVTYNPFGDVTTLSAPDAGGAELTSKYYTDNQLQSVTQHKSASQPEETIGYKLDPAGRTLETIATGELRAADTTNHYAGPSETPAWTSNTSGEWTRNIEGINGELAETESNGESRQIQLANLHGDIIATASSSQTATSLESTANTTEFGVPATSLPAKYGWLGAIQLPTELSTGVVSMGVRTYVPQLGRFLQPDPIPGGSPNPYSYTYGDPLNQDDPSGQATEYTIGGPSAALIAWAAQSSEEAAAQQAAENRAAQEAAERAALEAEEAAWAAYGPEYEEEWWEEWWEEEGEYEWASYKHGAENGTEETHIEPAVLYTPLAEEATSDGSSDDEPEGGFRILIKGGPGGHGCAKRKTCHHHGGGGGGTPEPKKKCPPGYLTIPVIEVCMTIELPDIGNHPVPAGPLPPEGPIPVG